MMNEADHIVKTDALVYKAHGIDEKEYPKTAEILKVFEMIPAENRDYDALADELSEADFTKVIPECIAVLIKEIYTYAVHQGNSMAANNLGCLYYKGRIGGVPDYDEAAKYYEMADKMGNPLSTENLAYIYYYGLGRDADYEKAYMYFSKAALGGRYEAAYKIGDMYRDGKYVEKDPMMTFHCYTKAEKLLADSKQSGNWGSIYHRIGDLFYYGIGTEKNLFDALHFYQLAETGYYGQIMNGDRYHNSHLKKVLILEKKIGSEIRKNLPEFEF